MLIVSRYLLINPCFNCNDRKVRSNTTRTTERIIRCSALLTLVYRRKIIYPRRGASRKISAMTRLFSEFIAISCALYLSSQKHPPFPRKLRSLSPSLDVRCSLSIVFPSKEQNEEDEETERETERENNTISLRWNDATFA